MNPNTGRNNQAGYESRNLFLRLARSFLPKGRAEAATVVAEAEDANDLVESIKKAKSEWINANMNFEFADEKDLVDYYSYKIKACEIQYEYLLRKAKEKGIKTDLVNNEVVCSNADY